MPRSNKDLIDGFLNGEKSGRSSSLNITTGENGYTVLGGYGSCGYAARSPQGELVIFGGWANEFVEEDSESDWLGAREHAGSHTVKAKHFRHLPIEDAQVVVAYHKARTEMEKNLLDQADIKTDDPHFAAPSTHEAADLCEYILRDKGMGRKP